MVTDTDTNTLTCVSIDGDCRFTYTGRDLKDPKGVTVDRDGNIYVCAQKSNAIHQIAPDGTRIKILLSQTDGIVSPSVMGFEPQGTDFFLISNEKSKRNMVQIYRMS